jgi:hypothetical protein
VEKPDKYYLTQMINMKISGVRQLTAYTLFSIYLFLRHIDYVPQHGLEQASSCLSLLSARITDVHHDTWLTACTLAMLW